MASMRYDRLRKAPVFMEAAATFCRRCGNKFTPLRRHHALCSTCASAKFSK